MYRGPAGVTALNERLQAALNPPGVMKPEKSLYGQIFRQGDKVMQIENNYDLEVFNGDIGFVDAIDPINHTLTVDFEGRRVDYDWTMADQLQLAYAVSVHKAQGAEFPVVVMPLVTQHYMMLQRNLLYTAITRPRSCACSPAAGGRSASPCATTKWRTATPRWTGGCGKNAHSTIRARG